MKKPLLSFVCLGLLLSCTNNTPHKKDGDGDPDPGEQTTNLFPIDSVKEFLLERGADLTNFELDITLGEDNEVLSYNEVENDPPYYKVEIKDNDSALLQNVSTYLNAEQWTINEGYYYDPTEEVALTFSLNNYVLSFAIYAANDLVEIEPPEEEEEQTFTKDFPLQNKGYIGENNNLNDKSFTFEDHFIFSFFKNDSSTTPRSEQAHFIAIYTGNTMTITCDYVMKKIEFTTNGNDGNLTSDVGVVNKTTEITSWIGSSKSVTFTALAQYRFNNVKIYYIEKEEIIPEGGEKTIAEVKQLASEMSYNPNPSGWYLSQVEVTVKVKAIDAIDSTTTSGLDGNARGKVLCVDETGYIICSSGVSRNNPIDFYQRVKDYIKAGTTTYEVTGHIAFFNDVVEIKVETYQYKSNLVINYDLNNFVNSDVTGSDTLMSHCKNIKTNAKGYGVGNIVRLNGLTYFNKYNSAGSYYFLDKAGKMVPIYSLLDKDRSSLQLGKVYDIIGLESMYLNRPSLRILQVIANTEVDPVSFDFENNVNLANNTTSFYHINEGDWKEDYYDSAITVYKMDAYVSRYTNDDYTINTTYYLYNKEYTTGSTKNNAAIHNSLGVFNEDLTYKQTLLDFLLENASSDEECQELKVTLYFTLAFLDKVEGKYMWRVNIFEDLVFSLDYYNSSKESIKLNSVDSTWTHSDTEQTFTSGNLSVTNASTELNDMSYNPSYLKIVDGTSLIINFNQPILGFTLYHATYSYIAGLGSLGVKAYRQFKTYTVILLTTPTKTIEIDDFAVGGNRNNAYLRVDSIQVNY